MYTWFVQCLRSVLRNVCAEFAQSLRRVCAMFARCLCNVCAMFVQCLCNVCAMFAQRWVCAGLRNVCARFAQCLRNVCAEDILLAETFICANIFFDFTMFAHVCACLRMFAHIVRKHENVCAVFTHACVGLRCLRAGQLADDLNAGMKDMSLTTYRSIVSVTRLVSDCPCT